VLDESALWQADFTAAAAAVMSPPIRRAATDGAALRAALVAGSLGPLGTDHCAFNSTQKARCLFLFVFLFVFVFAFVIINPPISSQQAAGRHDFRLIPNGVNGIGERMVLAWDALVASGLGTPMDYVRATSTAAAQAFHIYPRKGHVAPGSDADVIIFDPIGTTRIRRVLQRGRDITDACACADAACCALRAARRRTAARRTRTCTRGALRPGA
jgi:dihydropyrimidinase